MARILIVDDHHAARTTLRELLDWHSFQVCGDAQNGKEAAEKVIELKPEIVLMDINMPVMNGINAAQEIRRIAPGTKIVFLTVHDTPVFKAVRELRADVEENAQTCSALCLCGFPNVEDASTCSDAYLSEKPTDTTTDTEVCVV
jgi:CheY-like chemotaxis protein